MFASFLPTSAPKTWATATAVAALLVCAAPLPALAQAEASAAGQEFPADAQMLSASELDARLRGKVYTATLPNGASWRGAYKDSGYLFVNMSSGGSDSGKWRTEDGKVCVEYKGRMRSGCTEVRAVAQALHAKNATTGVITVLQPD